MRIHPTLAALGFAALGLGTAWTLMAPQAHAFTVENKDAGGGAAASQFAMPKFDLEEQAKNFRKNGDGTAAASKYETPAGTLQFGVRQGPVSGFGSGFGMGSGFGPGTLGPQPRNSRADFENMLRPESLR